MAMLYQGEHGDMDVNVEKFPFYHRNSMDYLVSSAEDADGEADYFHIGEGEDDGEKGKKSRERNREHAKKTRLRKKVLLEGMKGKLVQLQSEASKLQQAFEERKTANILLAFSKPGSDQKEDGMMTKTSSTTDDFSALHDFSSLKGNIIEQLRTRVRSEAAQKNQHANMLRQQQRMPNQMTDRQRSDSTTSTEGIPIFPPSSSSSSSSSCTVDPSNDMTVTSVTDIDLDSDNENDDLESYQPLPKSFVNWKNGTVVSEEGLVRRLADDEMEHLRKERNRIHAKLTRDRKKLFTSRMQQMISSLERQNVMMRDHLLSLASAAAPLHSPFKPPPATIALMLSEGQKSVSVASFMDRMHAIPLDALPADVSVDSMPGSTSSPLSMLMRNATDEEDDDDDDDTVDGGHCEDEQGQEHTDERIGPDLEHLDTGTSPWPLLLPPSRI